MTGIRSVTKRLLAISFFAALTTGCASIQEPVALDEEKLDDMGQSEVAIMMTALPEPDLLFPGAGCLLCIATAEGLHTSLSSHAENLDGGEFKLSKSQLAARLKEKGIAAKVIDEPLDLKTLPRAKSKEANAAAYDFSSLAETYQADYVVVISVSEFGFSREFASYIPTSEPVAVLRGKSFMVDPASHSYVWYRPFDIVKGVEGEWDQPPEFPKLTNAFYQVIAEARDAILVEFK